jgi:hypothetical protein
MKPTPSPLTVRQCIGILRKLVREEPDDPSTPYRRGMLEALTWVSGMNPRLHRLMGEAIKGYAAAHKLRPGRLVETIAGDAPPDTRGADHAR